MPFHATIEGMESSAGGRPGGGFDEALLGAVDEALLRLSEGVRHSVYWYLKCRYGFGREDIPSRPGDLEAGLRGLFGRGADIILRWAIEALYERLGLALEARPGWGFADYVAHAKGLASSPPSRS